MVGRDLFAASVDGWPLIPRPLLLLDRRSRMFLFGLFQLLLGREVLLQFLPVTAHSFLLAVVVVSERIAWLQWLKLINLRVDIRLEFF